MSNMTPQQPPRSVSPLETPDLLRPAHVGPTPQDSRPISSDSKAEKRSRFAESVDPAMGINMEPMETPMSPPDSVYQQKSGMYSPLPPAPRPDYFRAPGTNLSLTGVTRSRTDPNTERLIAHRATQASEWTIHWRTPAMMVASFVVGVCLAMGQHFLYAWLHHRVLSDEEEKVRMVLYGRALAFFSKVAFCSCCILVFRQRIWRTFRSSALSVLSIDQLFLATEDPSLFLNWETLSKAPFAVATALVIWLIPLATIIFSPGALSFGWYYDQNSVNLTVPNLNFSMETIQDWRIPMLNADGTSKRSLMYWNTTDIAGTKPGFVDYFDQPSSDLTRVSYMMAYSMMNHPVNRQDARFKSCGGDYNCTYTTSFVGPGYKCEMIANSADDNDKLADLGAPFNTSVLVPQGKYVYLAQVDEGEYKKPQAANLGQGGIPLGDTPEDLGVFKAEPVLWIGYSVNSTEKLSPDDPLAKNWTRRYDPHVFRCIHYETKYTVQYDYTDPFFKMNTTYEYLSPILDTNFTKYANGTINFDDPQPSTNYILPGTDIPRYRRVAAYHALGMAMRKFLRGNIELEAEFPGPSFARVASEITQTRLVSNITSEPVSELPRKIQSFYSDLALSLFSAPQMSVVSETTVEVKRTRYQSTFIYSPGKLWGCYAPVIFFTLLILLMGAWTIYKDGTTFSVGFSRILVATRNQTLDEIARGACLANDPFPMELMETKLQFGVLNEHAEMMELVGPDGPIGVGHCAFGVPSEVSPIRRGVPYAGLRRRPARGGGGGGGHMKED
jgi:hypothetical protein